MYSVENLRPDPEGGYKYTIVGPRHVDVTDFTSTSIEEAEENAQRIVEKMNFRLCELKNS